jgi:hypothetical protein
VVGRVSPGLRRGRLSGAAPRATGDVSHIQHSMHFSWSDPHVPRGKWDDRDGQSAEPRATACIRVFRLTPFAQSTTFPRTFIGDEGYRDEPPGQAQRGAIGSERGALRGQFGVSVDSSWAALGGPPVSERLDPVLSGLADRGGHVGAAGEPNAPGFGRSESVGGDANPRRGLARRGRRRRT